jgi:hypothetical protein
MRRKLVLVNCPLDLLTIPFTEAPESQPAEKLTNGDHAEEDPNGGGTVPFLALACYCMAHLSFTNGCALCRRLPDFREASSRPLQDSSDGKL